jgi:hypothetical protein
VPGNAIKKVGLIPCYHYRRRKQNNINKLVAITMRVSIGTSGRPASSSAGRGGAPKAERQLKRRP